MGYLSRKTFGQRWRGDREALKEQIELFLGHAPAQIQELQEAVHAEHAASLVSSARSLKSLIQPLRVKTLAHSLGRLESDGERGDMSGARQELMELRACFDEVYSELLELLQDLERQPEREETAS